MSCLLSVSRNRQGRSLGGRACWQLRNPDKVATLHDQLPCLFFWNCGPGYLQPSDENNLQLKTECCPLVKTSVWVKSSWMDVRRHIVQNRQDQPLEQSQCFFQGDVASPHEPFDAIRAAVAPWARGFEPPAQRTHGISRGTKMREDNTRGLVNLLVLKNMSEGLAW